MDENRARLLAIEYGEIEARTPSDNRRDDEYGGRHSDPMLYAIGQQLIATIPDTADAVALRRLPRDPEGEAKAVVAAVDGRRCT